MKAKVSVIIPNYNHAAFLQQRIESVINQSYNNFEVIILDDFSTDESKSIIELYRLHPKVSQIIYNHTNSGSPFLQWQKGIEATTGELIWIAESDDSCRFNFLQTLVPILEENSGLNLVFCDSERNELEWRKIQQLVQSQLQFFKGTEFVKQKMLTSPVIINASAVLFRRDVVGKRVWQKSNNYKSAFDWLFWCNIILHGDVAFYPIKLNYFRQHLQNTSLKATQQGLFVSEGLQVISDLKKDYQINLNQTQLNIWASIWAQTCLLSKQTKKNFLQNNKLAWKISPKLLVSFVYYLLKFKFFSSPNIKIQEA